MHHYSLNNFFLINPKNFEKIENNPPQAQGTLLHTDDRAKALENVKMNLV